MKAILLAIYIVLGNQVPVTRSAIETHLEPVLRTGEKPQIWGAVPGQQELLNQGTASPP